MGGCFGLALNEKIKHLANADKIVMSNDDYVRLTDWWVNVHEGETVKFSPVMSEGLILLDYQKDQGMILYIYFKHKDDHNVAYEIHRQKGDILTTLMVVERNYKTFKYTVLWHNEKDLPIPKEVVTSYVDSITGIHPAVMSYMEFYKEERDRVSYTKHRILHSKQKKNGKKKKSVKPITMYTYTLHPSEDHTGDKDKQQYNRMTESWLVRGHWRNLKDGRKVWVKSYVKGKQDDDREPNEYRFNEE